MQKWIYKNKNKKGFTLIELIVVIAILGILAAIAVPRFSKVQENAKINADAATSESIINAAKIYIAQNNSSISEAKAITVDNLVTAGLIEGGVKLNSQVDKTKKFSLSYTGDTLETLVISTTLVNIS